MARLSGERLRRALDFVVSGRERHRVDGVRYLHKNWAQPDICIFSEDGLPAFPFMNLRAAK